MRRVLKTSAVLLVGMAGPAVAARAAGGQSAGGQSAGRQTASLDHFVCRRSAQPHGRMMSVQAVMRHRPGTERMALRFVLLWTRPGYRSTYNEQGGDLGRWRHPTNPPTLGQKRGDVWRVTQRVRNLAPEGVYQFRVDFRWTGTGGKTLYQR